MYPLPPRLSLGVVLSLLVLSAAHAPLRGAPPPPLRSYSVTERYGVSHPQQIIDFDGAPAGDPRNWYVIGPDGREAPFQLLGGGKLAVMTDLPAGAKKTWRLQAGRPQAPFAGRVTLRKHGGGYELVNGLTGVRIPTPPADLSRTPAPIQGVRYADGAWSATGPNFLSVAARAMEVQVLEQGPLKAVVVVLYRFPRPELRDGERVVAPAGEGFYRCTVELQAGQPSVLVEDDTDVDFSYTLDLYPGLLPTQARYRGARSESPEAGRDESGRKYEGHNGKVATDAIVDLKYDRPRDYPRMGHWHPWIESSGWYWMLYNPAGSRLAGIFGGRASRLIGATNSGVNVFTRPGSGSAPPACGLRISSLRRTEDGRVFPRTRFHWGLFVGTREEHLKPIAEVQPINRQMNLHGGINLNKLHRYVLDYPDPARGYGALFMEKAPLQQLNDRIRREPEGDDFRRLAEGDGYSRELLQFWSDSTGERRTAVVDSIGQVARGFLEAMVNGNGIYDWSPDQLVTSYSYWMGALEMSRKALWIDQVLADPKTPAVDQSRVKAFAATFGMLLSDDDYVPLFEGHGMHLGNPNMPVLQQGIRSQFTLLLAEHPVLRSRVAEVEKKTLATLHEIVNAHGASMSATNYIGAGFAPTLDLLLQLRMQGKDHFGTDPRLRRFSEFYMHLLTPPEVRFGGPRKLVAFGDSSTQRSELFGALASGFRTADPALSARLMGAWTAAGKPHSSFFGTSILKNDEAAPAREPALGDATFPGYLSVLRHGWGKPHETAVWMIDGDYYHDHRHMDQGSVAIYALGAPLSLDWGSLYYPQVAGGFMHSMVLPESSIGAAEALGHPPAKLHGWNQDSPPLHTSYFVWGVPPWGKASQDAFLSFDSGSLARARFKSEAGPEWIRSIYSIRPDPAHPLILIQDRFAGEDAGPKIFTLNLAAQGEVETPTGRVSPPMRTHDAQGGREPNKKELPSAGPVFPLQPGLNRLGFTGQWKIDWDLYTFADEPQQAHVGNWAHFYHPHTEQVEFRKANDRPFEERQHILRVRGQNGFNTLILPYPKGRRPSDLKVVHSEAGVTVTQNGAETRLDASGFTFRRSDKLVVTASFGTARVGGRGISIQGGPAEVIVDPKRAVVTLSGPAGPRSVRLPAGSWKPVPKKGAATPVRRPDGAWELRQSGVTPSRFEFSR
ncbi:MAG: hypothetical protein ACK47B_15915 [Armatimonadota bacterium]